MTLTQDAQDAALARLESVLDRLERLGLAAPPEVEPLAAGTVPPHVAAGELIQSSWGNAVVDMLAWLNTRRGITALSSPSVPGGTLQTVSWVTLSNQDWGTGPTLIAPADTIGLYMMSCTVSGPAIVAGAFGDAVINVNSNSFKNYIPSGKAAVTVSALTSLSPADQVSVQVYNPNGTAAYFNTTLVVYAVAP